MARPAAAGGAKPSKRPCVLEHAAVARAADVSSTIDCDRARHSAGTAEGGRFSTALRITASRQARENAS
jgi:hypothetical protein